MVGSTTALELARLGYKIELFDPDIFKSINYSETLSGTNASLGVLMGSIFKRNTGRSWRLRKRSMELWPSLIKQLNTTQTPLCLERPLIKLARSKHELEQMVDLIRTKKDMGLELLKPNSSIGLRRSWIYNNYGGLISRHDGRINPFALMESLMKLLDHLKVKKTNKQVLKIDRVIQSQETSWKLFLDNQESRTKDCIIICAPGSSEALLKPLGHDYPLEPVLGQAINLELKEDRLDWSGWPAVLFNNNINLIPHSHNQMLIGATIEPGVISNTQILKDMKDMDNLAPPWIKLSSIKNQWKGIRFKPKKEPAPLLKNLEQGLILNTAHYRNGILLAPACAEWVGNELIKT
ncbi:D-amino acid dehydrogenase small subunit [Prochlorococcus sp. MIT 0601]|nr:D-amino acid dehydrogenase small subunit [Prochlorococcus sp. MIT 0601]